MNHRVAPLVTRGGFRRDNDRQGRRKIGRCGAKLTAA
jgi:hypothetical protein